MHANRPVYKNVEVAQPGVERSVVIHELGLPKMSFEKEGRTTDVYTLAPEGETQSTKVAVTSLHAVADAFTLFLWEAVATPYELVTAPTMKTYVVSYTKEGKVDRVEEHTANEAIAPG